MKIAVISVNRHGDSIAESLRKVFDIDLYSKKAYENFNITELTGRLMKEYKNIIFLSSTGIAVRAIAPYIASKVTDPAVLVIDISGKYVISLISGHIGGANALAERVAKIIGGQAIITTATDNIGVQAPDLIAMENGLVVSSLKDAKVISSLLVDGKNVAFIDEENLIEAPVGYSNNFKEAHGLVYITNKNFLNINLCSSIKTLKLIRKNIVLGIGCRKNYSPEKMRDIVLQKLEENEIDPMAIKIVTSIELKKDEKAIKTLAEFLKAEFRIFTIDEIKEIQHNYSGSDFVEMNVGVRAVCEPCIKLCRGEFITDKICEEGMTLCIGKVV